MTASPVSSDGAGEHVKPGMADSVGPTRPLILPRIAALTLALVCASACRDDVEPFDPAQRGFVDQPRLTVSPGDERAPTWSLDGESLLYTAEGLVGVDSGPGLLLRFSFDEARSQALLPNVQSPNVAGTRWLVTPAPRPGGSDIGFVEIVSLWPPHPCDLALTNLFCQPPRAPDEARRPPLREIAVRVRGLDTTTPLDDDPALNLVLAGTETTSEQTSISSTFPFQQLFERESAFGFRISWAPEGDRLALSDGLNILIWTVGAEKADTIPNTEDGVWPAWSPDGEWIAFTRLERIDPTSVSCDYVGGFGTVCTQLRTEYTIGRHILTLIRPDGSRTIELGSGDEPAWGPDGRALYFRNEDRIWRMDLQRDGDIQAGEVTPIPETEGGREPAVSPDGRALAFSRLEGGGYNLWVVPLEP